MTNIYIQKIASNAVSRRLNDGTLGMSVGGGALNSGANTAAIQVGKNQLANGVTGSARSQAMISASKAQAGKVPSSAAVKAFGDSGTDRLATTSIQQRLAEHRSKLGLGDSNGRRVSQIANAHALRANKSQLTGVGGRSGMTGGMHTNSSAFNAAAHDASSGHQSVLNVGKADGQGRPSVSHVSSKPAAVAGPKSLSLLAKVKNMGSNAMGKLKSLPGKKIAIGAGVIGAGAYGVKKINDNSSGGYSNY